MKKYEEENYKYENICDKIYPWVKTELTDSHALNGKHFSKKDAPVISFLGSWKGEVRMQEEKTAENKANYIDGGNFKARIGNTTYLVGVFFNKAKKVTIEDRMKNLICQEVTAGNF